MLGKSNIYIFYENNVVCFSKLEEINLYDHVGSLSLHHSSGNPIHLLTTAVDIEKSAGSLETRGGETRVK